MLLGLLRGVPVLVWVVVVAVAWGGYQRHNAKVQERAKNAVIQKVAAEEAKALRASIAESERRVQAHQEIASAAQAKVDELERSRAAVRVVTARVRPAAVAFAASAAASNPAAAGDCQAAEAATGVLADLLGRVVERAEILAHLAGRTNGAGQTCEALYDALRKKP